MTNPIYGPDGDTITQSMYDELRLAHSNLAARWAEALGNVTARNQEIERLQGVIETREEALRALTRAAVEPSDGPHRAFLEMPEGYNGPVKISNPGAPVAEVTVYKGAQKSTASQCSCDSPSPALHDVGCPVRT